MQAKAATPIAPKVVIVTGAGSGIGRATSLAFLQQGDWVVLAGRRAPTLHAVREQSAHPQNALVCPTDVCCEADVVALFNAAVAQFGRVDLLFNNAGTSAPGEPLDELPLAQWQAVVDVNLTGMFLCLREAFRVMKRQSPQGGRIINNGSIAATTPRPNSVAYTATKHAVTGLTKSAALDGRAFGIAVGQIDIGNAATDMTHAMAQGIVQANGQLLQEPVMDVALAAQSVLYMAGLPLQANVLFHTVMATRMPFVGRG
jgi:NAD(P)-dependent dehydrogenase (short-subunit alcohol dehydrogenase family)